MLIQVLLPPGTTMNHTRDVLGQVSRHYLEDEKDAVESVLTVVGFSFGGRGQNAGIAFVKLKDWGERQDARLHAGPVAGRAMAAFSRIKEAMVFAFVPPAVPELGNATGFELQLQDRGGLGHDQLMAARNQLLGWPRRSPTLAKVRPAGLDDTPQYQIDVDQQKASALGLSVADVNATLSTTWGTAYLNDFIDKGRIKRVYMQADAPFRMKPEDVNRWYVRNRAGADGALLRLLQRTVDLRLAQARALQRLPRRGHPGRAGAGQELRRGDGDHGGAREAAARRASASSGRGSPTRSGSPARTPRPSTPSRCWWSSSPWPRCTRAGPSRSR